MKKSYKPRNPIAKALRGRHQVHKNKADKRYAGKGASWAFLDIVELKDDIEGEETFNDFLKEAGITRQGSNGSLSAS